MSKIDVKVLWETAKNVLGEEELSRRFRLWLQTITRNAQQKGSIVAVVGRYDQEIHDILSDLNNRTKSRFTATDQAKRLIIALLKQGYTLQDFVHVHEIKCAKWIGDDKMEHCLRPSTLYRPSHFDEYLNEWRRADNQRKELEARRKAARAGMKSSDPEVKEGSAELISTLNSKPWHAFDSWLNFMRWIMRFPDAESLAAYEMPPELRSLRQEKGMVMQIAAGKCPAHAEEAYAEAKRRWRVANGSV